MRKGLLYVWATAIAGMFLVYLLFSYLTPFIGLIDYYVGDLWYTLGLEDSPFKALYDTWKPILRDVFGYMSGILFFSLIAYLILNSARREPNEAAMAY